MFYSFDTVFTRSKLTLKNIHNIQYVASMNPTAGSFTINPRLQRHFATFAVAFPGPDALFTIYNAILSGHLENASNKFPYLVKRLGEKIVNATVQLHKKCAQIFSPTAVKFHYIFNLRDLSNVFQGIMFTTNECVNSTEELVKLWVHETHRVYRDKLADTKDIEMFDKTPVKLHFIFDPHYLNIAVWHLGTIDYCQTICVGGWNTLFPLQMMNLT